jgi:transketolase
VTLEEHSVHGGLGSAAAEALAESGVPARLRRLGMPDAFAHAVGSREHLLEHFGLDGDSVAHATLELLEGVASKRSLT